MADDFDYCEALVREADKDRFVAALFAAAPRRRALHALYAFNVELARVRELAREPMPGEIRLQWWRDVLGGQPSGEAGPVASALVGTVVRYRLPMDVVSEMIEARSFDLYDDPMGSLAELEAYAGKDVVGADTARGASPQRRQRPAPERRCAARRHRLCHRGAAGRVSLACRTPAALCAPRPDAALWRGAGERIRGHATPALMAALSDLRDVARAHLSQISVADIPAALVPAFLPAALVAPMLKRLEQSAADPFSTRPLPQWRRQWILWRAARDPRRIAGA